MKLDKFSGITEKSNQITVIFDRGIEPVMGKFNIVRDVRNPNNDSIQKLYKKIGSNISYKNYISDIKKLCPYCDSAVASEMNKVLIELGRIGKNENALNNLYIRFLCWLITDFKCVYLNRVDYLYYFGEVNDYLVRFFEILKGFGIYIIIFTESDINVEFLELQGVDYTYEYDNINSIDVKILSIGTNTWLIGDNFNEVLVDYNNRSGQNCTKSALIKVNGVDDKTTYLNELYELYQQTKGLCVILDSFEMPTPNELTELRQYKDDNMSKYVINFCTSLNLDKESFSVLTQEFLSISRGYSEKDLLCLFFSLKNILKYSKIKDRHYLYFLQMDRINRVQADLFYIISCLMFDVIIFNPKNIDDDIKIKMVYEINYDYILDVKKFPTSNFDLVVETTAYSAEKEIKGMLYDGSTGVYDIKQFKTARVVYLKPTIDEISILWDKEVSLRQGFKSSSDSVVVPVIFAKILGVGSNKVDWLNRLYNLIGDKDFVFCNRGFSIIEEHNGGNSALDSITTMNRINSAEVLRNGKIDKELFKDHKCYKYKNLSIDMQNHMIDKLQDLLDSGLYPIEKRGIVENIFNMFVNIDMREPLVRLLMNFDFTKINPKIVYVIMDTSILHLLDEMLLYYLSFIGFDIVVFAPTGFNNEFLKSDFISVYDEGRYVSPFNIDYNAKKVSFFNKLFFKGR